MRRLAAVFVMGAFVALLAIVPSNGPFAQDGSKPQSASAHQFEVLNPWAEVDPKPVRGISPRVQTLAGKKIGLFANYKRASVPMVTTFEKKIKERFPDVQTSLFHSTRWNVTEAEYDKAKFETWVKGVDAVVAAVGD